MDIEMEINNAARKIQYTWRLHLLRKTLYDAFHAEIEQKAIELLRTLQKTFRIKLRKRRLQMLVEAEIRRIERQTERQTYNDSLNKTNIPTT